MRARAIDVAHARHAALLVRVAALAVLVPLLLRLRPARLAEFLERIPVRSPARPPDIDRLRHAVARVLPMVPGSRNRRCQVRGILLFWLLRSAGVDVTLVYGIGKPAADFAGHCWLIRDGEPYLERKDPRLVFSALYRIPRCSPAPVLAAGAEMPARSVAST